MLGRRPWMIIVAIVLFMLVLSIGFLVIALRNPPVPHEPAGTGADDGGVARVELVGVRSNA